MCLLDVFQPLHHGSGVGLVYIQDFLCILDDGVKFRKVVHSSSLGENFNGIANCLLAPGEGCLVNAILNVLLAGVVLADNFQEHLGLVHHNSHIPPDGDEVIDFISGATIPLDVYSGHLLQAADFTLSFVHECLNITVHEILNVHDCPEGFFVHQVENNTVDEDGVLILQGVDDFLCLGSVILHFFSILLGSYVVELIAMLPLIWVKSQLWFKWLVHISILGGFKEFVKLVPFRIGQILL